MNKLNLIIENSAELDMIAIADYIAKDKKSAASKILKLFIHLLKSFQFIPKLGFLDPT